MLAVKLSPEIEKFCSDETTPVQLSKADKVLFVKVILWPNPKKERIKVKLKNKALFFIPLNVADLLKH
jgi:hypothetical protein